MAKCIKTNYRDFYSWRKEKSTAATVSGRNLKISSLAQTLKLTASCLYELTRGDKSRVPSSSKGQGWDHLACSRDTIYTLAPVTTCSEINAVVHKKKGKVLTYEYKSIPTAEKTPIHILFDSWFKKKITWEVLKQQMNSNTSQKG